MTSENDFVVSILHFQTGTLPKRAEAVFLITIDNKIGYKCRNKRTNVILLTRGTFC
jgi:hypothetical protein